MFTLPKLKRIQTTEMLEIFSEIYASYSGLPIPKTYLESNQVFAIFYRETMIGGFILGEGKELRTVQLFAQEEHQNNLKNQVGSATEICCLWIDKKFQRKLIYNFWVWLALLLCLQKYASAKIVFGTNSRRLGTLYNASSKIECLHYDFIHRKQTFIFIGAKRDSMKGIIKILNYKLKRIFKIYFSAKKLRKISLS